LHLSARNDLRRWVAAVRAAKIVKGTRGLNFPAGVAMHAQRYLYDTELGILARSPSRRRLEAKVKRSSDTAQHTQSNGDANDPPGAMLGSMAAHEFHEARCQCQFVHECALRAGLLKGTQAAAHSGQAILELCRRRRDHLSQYASQPLEPLIDATLRSDRGTHDPDGWVDPLGQFDGRRRVEVHMRHQIELAEDHNVSRGKGIRVLDGFVGSLGHGQNDDTLRLAEVETCGTHEVADVLNEENAMLAKRQVRCRVPHRMGIEMATPPGVDLDSRHTDLANAIGVVAGLLVALDDPQRHFRPKRLESLYEQRGFSCSWARHQVQAEDAQLGPAGPVFIGETLVFSEDALLDRDQIGRACGFAGRERR